MADQTPETLEVIGLSIAFEALKSMVNRSMLDVLHLSDGSGEVEVRFKSTPHRDLFYIRLLDFAHEGGSRRLLGTATDMSCLEILETVGSAPRLSTPESAQELAHAAAQLRTWLEHTVQPKFWLGDIDINARLSVTRLRLLKIVGNQAKHNMSRLTGVCGQVQKLLADNGHDVAFELMPFAIEDLRAHLGENMFIYYGSWLAELLNDLTWALYRYVRPIYQRQIVFEEGPLPGFYRYEPLAGVDPKSPAHFWLYRLLNDARSTPYIPPFRASHYLKQQSGLEWEDA
ncbi:hypothetical protein ABE473_11020 [Stenotrophomonas sp. TWI700]|uniref:hypothetical protein n=1 Tax=Stenotrophomonas sp. TWI700 TaxID=3136792 RepID=UPI003207BADF